MKNLECMISTLRRRSSPLYLPRRIYLDVLADLLPRLKLLLISFSLLCVLFNVVKIYSCHRNAFRKVYMFSFSYVLIRLCLPTDEKHATQFRFEINPNEDTSSFSPERCYCS